MIWSSGNKLDAKRWSIAVFWLRHTTFQQPAHCYHPQRSKNYLDLFLCWEARRDHKILLHACRNHLCADRASAIAADLHGVVRHLEWRRDPVLGELDCGHRGVRVEPSRLPQRHTQLKAGRPPQELTHRPFVKRRDFRSESFASISSGTAHFRSSPTSGHFRCPSGSLKSATKRLNGPQQFSHLIAAGEQRGWNGGRTASLSLWWRSKDKLRGERNSGVDGVCDEAMSFDAVHGFAGRLEFDSAPEHDPGSDRDFSEAIFPLDVLK